MKEPSAKYLARPRYKQTEVGRIPADWAYERLTSVAKLESGHTPSRRNSAYWGGSIPWVSLHDTGALDEREIFDTAQRITPEGLANSSARLLPKGTVVFSRTATVGKATVMGREMATSQDFANYICGPQANNHFLVYLFRGMTSEWRRLMAGSIHNTVYMPVFKVLRVLLPPVQEQEAIADALNDVDLLIKSLERLLAKKREIKQGAMQELLTAKRRLPGFGGEWVVKRLGSCLRTRPDYGINAPAVPYSDRLPTYIRITDITDDGRFRPDPRVSVQSTLADQYLLSDGDVLFARTGASVGKSYRYRLEDGPLVFAGFLIRIRPDPTVLLSAYLAAYAMTNSYWNWVRLMSMRSGQPGINANEYARLPVSLPNIDEQTAITAVLSGMASDISAVETKLAKARQLKQGMMQELLTGRIRLV